jgi:formylglycine-generating enzyme required for sulfatase activity
LPTANDRVFDDPWQTLAFREELPFSLNFRQCIDIGLALRPSDRWQDAGQWLSALGSRMAVTVIHETANETTCSPSAWTEIGQPPQIASPAVPEFLEHEPGEERDFELCDGCKIEMCWIPAGDFLMGSAEDEPGRRDDEAQHHVILSKGFWMAKYPVTQGQWRAVMQTYPFNFGQLNLKTRLNDDACLRELKKWENHPVENVSWNDICESRKENACFLAKINSRTSDGWCYDLPTEAQWEHACRSGCEGDENEELDDLAWFCQNSDGSTRPVGLKCPNPWGIHDMLGNVWEWCADWYSVYPNKTATDPKGPDYGPHRVGSSPCRVLRGSSWANDSIHCRIASRDYDLPHHANSNIGFRIVLRKYS